MNVLKLILILCTLMPAIYILFKDIYNHEEEHYTQLFSMYFCTTILQIAIYLN